MKIPRFLFHALALLLFFSCSSDSNSPDTSIIEDENGDPVTVDISANRKSTGESANELLSDKDFDKLTIEIIYVEGLAPSEDSLDNLKTFLEGLLNKPFGIEIVQQQIESPGKSVFSIADIRNLEDDVRKEYNDDKKIAVSGIFLDGEYDMNTDSGSVLGVAYRNTSFVIFEETIRSFSGQPLSPSLETLESVVINHEFGHLLGLVNAGTTMQVDHQDEEHGRHCDVDTCLMYWTAETGEGLLNMLTGGSIPELDGQCLDDLKANGGK
ncbi:MAG: membrane metalloprotease [Allomuricauda sp.]